MVHYFTLPYFYLYRYIWGMGDTVRVNCLTQAGADF